jgi:hypothetical protein
MDSLLTFEIVAAIFILSRDGGLRSQAALWSFGFTCGAAIMTKGIAGSLPLLILAFIAPVRLAQVIGIAALFAAPWHIYQSVGHPRWFWAEYFRTEIFSWGLASPEQTTNEGHLGFYAKRLFLLDPVLPAAAAVAVFKWRPKLPLVWLLVIFISVIAFQYRNAAYLLPAYAAMAILAGGAIPQRARALALASAVTLFGIKVAAPKQPWGLPFAPEYVNPSYAALDRYAALQRGNDLILIEPTVLFRLSAASACPLFVRGLEPDPSEAPLDFEYLGIVMSAADFNQFPKVLPIFEQRLREFDLPSGGSDRHDDPGEKQRRNGGGDPQHPEADYFRAGEFTLANSGYRAK